MMRIISTSAVTLVATISLVSLALGAGCASASSDEKVRASESAYGTPPLMPPPWNEDIPMNGLPTRALVANFLSTNYENSGQFIASPLTTGTFAAGGVRPALSDAVNDPATRDFLRYVVSCALTSAQHVQVETPSGTVDMQGRLGLCPEWNAENGTASVACQERVSACLLTFNNAMSPSVTVPLSIRGMGAYNLLPLAPEVRPVTVTEAESGFDPAPKIAAFNACASYSYGVDDACGYNPHAGLTAYVGKCTPGATIHVGTGAPCGSSPGYSSGDSVLRVCDGLRGCDVGSSGYLDENDDSPCGTLASYVTFTCRDSGAFSVMVAAYDRSAPITVTAAASSEPENRVTYPVSEHDLFTKREGAFFGNIFRQDLLAVSYSPGANGEPVPSPPLLPPGQFSTPYQGMFACNDPSWTAGDAYMANRVCASGGSMPCAATPVGDCSYVCASSDAYPAGYGAYGACMGGGMSWSAPLTSYLHSRTDVLGQGCSTCGGQ